MRRKRFWQWIRDSAKGFYFTLKKDEATQRLLQSLLELISGAVVTSIFIVAGLAIHWFLAIVLAIPGLLIILHGFYLMDTAHD